MSAFVGLVSLTPARPLQAQANALPSAATPPVSADSQDQRGRVLLDQMVKALGGPLWLNRRDVQMTGHTASFFRGQPTVSVNFTLYRSFANGTHGEEERIEFATPRMLLHGEVHDVVQVWTADQGWEITYKGKTPLPREQVQDHLRRRDHSIEAVMRTWLQQPGVMVLAEGTTMVERRLADKVTVLSANNDAVTLELDQNTHLPLRRTFEWRNNTFQDHDEDVETYDDWHDVQGLPTALNTTRYRNGDMANQRFYIKVKYNADLSPGLFNPDNLLKKK